MESISAVKTATKSFFSKVLSGTLLIAGTAIGAGMLGIPLLTAQAGLYPALLITGLVWIFMLATGLLVVEATLWMPPGANILTITGRLLGNKGRLLAGVLFLFLYYCLMTAYVAGGAPIFSAIFTGATGLSLPGMSTYILFALLFGLIVMRGVRSIDRMNLLLMIGMAASYAFLVGFGAQGVSMERFVFFDLPAAFTAAPVLFSAFGYHNVIPSLCTYLERDRKALRLSVCLGTTIALIVYVIWQWLVIGSVPLEAIAEAKAAGQPATVVLQAITANPWLGTFASGFGFLALVTSLLGVALSMVDFLADGLRKYTTKRFVPTLLTFVPPLLIAIIDPTLFDRALGISGGFGEAFLNGLLPVLLVWAGRYKLKLGGEEALGGGKPLLWLLGAVAVSVFFLEAIALLT
jgi:tyrosine-specific transport protein